MKPSFTTTIDGALYSAITIAPQDAQLPAFLLSGEKKPSYLYDGERLIPWYWHGFSVVDGMRVLTFDPLDLFPFVDLATTRRADALNLVRKASEALSLADSSFLSLFSGTIALWRLWITGDGKILILSDDLGDLFASVASEEERYFNLASWVHHNIHPAFSLIDQMVSLLYYSATGTPPFFSKQVREDSFRHVPMAHLQTDLDPTTATFIDSALSMGMKQMRSIAGNKKPQEALSAFLEASETLQWNLENRSERADFSTLLVDARAVNFVAAQEKRANRKAFWRRHGWCIISASIGIILVATFIGGRIKSALAPPYTAEYTPIEIIEAYYQGINDLDIIAMDEPLARKVKNPFSMEVTSLFVTRQTRQAYEQINVHVNPQEWIDGGKQPIDPNLFIYGVSDLEITALSESEYAVTATYWSPFSDEEDQLKSYTHTLQQSFTIEMGKKGWYEITHIGNPVISEPVEVTIPRIEPLGTPQ